MKHKDYSIYRSFLLGTIMHYLADSFTYVHNDVFKGTLKDHVAYEKELNEHFMFALNEMTHIKHLSISTTLINHLSQLHKKYKLLPQSIETDIEYITKACRLTFLLIM